MRNYVNEATLFVLGNSQSNLAKEFPRRNRFGNNQEISPSATRQFSPNFSSEKSQGHPEDLLNQLSLNDKLNFRNKFNSLYQEQQQYVFQKLTSSSPQNQVTLCPVI